MGDFVKSLLLVILFAFLTLVILDPLATNLCFAKAALHYLKWIASGFRMTESFNQKNKKPKALVEAEVGAAMDSILMALGKERQKQDVDKHESFDPYYTGPYVGSMDVADPVSGSKFDFEQSQQYLNTVMVSGISPDGTLLADLQSQSCNEYLRPRIDWNEQRKFHGLEMEMNEMMGPGGSLG